MRVLAIHRYPVKSAIGETLSSASLTHHGITGDRTWACLDSDGAVGSAKQPRLWQRLLEVTARLAQPPHDVTVTVPGHTPAPAGSAEADTALSMWLARPVRLTRTVTPQAKLHRWWPDEPGMIPDWASGAAPGQDAAATVSYGKPGRFYDHGTVHIVTAAGLAILGRQHRSAVDPLRFRPNLVLDLAAEPPPGQRLRIGHGAVVEVTIPTPRCVIPALAHGDSPADPTLLRTLARHHRTDVPGYGRATCFGFYANVIEPGTVNAGDRCCAV